MTDPTLRDLTDRLAELLDDRPTAEHALHDAMRQIPIVHAAQLRDRGSVRVLALDPCPWCGGQVVGAGCARCGFTVEGGGA